MAVSYIHTGVMDRIGGRKSNLSGDKNMPRVRDERGGKRERERESERERARERERERERESNTLVGGKKA